MRGRQELAFHGRVRLDKVHRLHIALLWTFPFKLHAPPYGTRSPVTEPVRVIRFSFRERTRSEAESSRGDALCLSPSLHPVRGALIASISFGVLFCQSGRINFLTLCF